MPMVSAVGHEQHHAVAGASRRIVELPSSFGIKADEGRDPSIAVEIGPLVGEAQMGFDDASVDGLQIEHAGVALEVSATPLPTPFLDDRRGLGADFPGIERPFTAGETAGM